MTARAETDGDSPGKPGGHFVSEPAGIRDLTQAEAAAEFETLADNIPTLCWMARADGHIYWYNRRWYEYTGTSLETQEGWGWETVHDPAVLPAVLAAWQHSLKTGTPFEMTFPLKGADGVFRPFLTRVVPIRDDDGTLVRWFGTNTDIDSLEKARSSLQLRTAELESLYESAPIGLAFFDREHRYLRVNRELAAMNGKPVDQHIGRSVREVLGEPGAAVEPIIEHVFASGEALRDFEVSTDEPDQPGAKRHWLTGFYPVIGEDSSVDAVGAWIVEITERKAAQEREILLAREVDHRAKNLLAVVQSIVQLTPASNGEELKASIVGRIQALARAHSLLSDARWDGVDLGDLVREELAPFAAADGRLSCDGPKLLLRPAAAQSLALVLHELATNAAKYGALSSASGQVRVEWRRDSDESGAFVEIVWAESGGPDPGQPELSGFGSKIIYASINRQLRGKVTKDWRREGLYCTIRIAAAEAAPGSEV